MPVANALLTLPQVWEEALLATDDLPDTAARAAAYYFPPPFFLTRDGPAGARQRHNWARIRLFARQRLVDLFISGHPPRLDEWREALFGNCD